MYDHIVCPVTRMSLQQQERARRKGIEQVMNLTADLLSFVMASKRVGAADKECIEYALRILHEDVFAIAHLNGYIDCGGKRVPRKRSRKGPATNPRP